MHGAPQSRAPAHRNVPRDSILRRFFRLFDVDVVADDAPETAAADPADDGALHLVATGRRADDGTRGGADRGVALGVLPDDRRTGRGADVPAAVRRNPAAARARGASAAA